jgi:hypothetical protein
MNNSALALCVLLVAAADTGWCACARDRVQFTADDKIAYMQREGRCEGVYALPTAVQEVQLVGYHAGAVELDAQKQRTARIVVLRGQSKEQILLRAESIRWGLHYQMDTRLSPSNDYDWPLDVLRRVGLAADEIALLACSNGCAMLASTVLFPVAVNPSGSNEYAFVVLSPAILEKLWVAIFRQGEVLHTICSDRTFIEKGATERFRLPGLDAGEYQAVFGGKLRYTNETLGKVQVTFSVPGNTKTSGAFHDCRQDSQR